MTNSKQFLQIGGAILVLVAILGYVGIIGPTPDRSLFGESWYFDNAENVAHLVLGVVALAAAFALKNAEQQKWLVLAVGALGILVGLYGFMSEALLGANLENPADNILHLVIGAWAFWSAMKTKAGMMPGTTM
jgi:hypothetical protein